ncbi:alpha-1,2-fucosyltransferase [Aliterella atlantica]|uniref:Glycosyl transferase n=1 Tax=Aliterella atlantica CENA595 TaxID=1618023 RepID=A0A0D8ZKK2_9CYAN|nr:alpha-1,2-fucosyltransferase [Aliterella atlantica]KJH69368.1 glycosyl transferase [Aliterella atlantica CENA595]
MNKDSKYSTRSETERIFYTLDSLDRTAETTAIDTASKSEQCVLSMSSLGKLGRFGNQLFQYAFLRICALKSGAKVECPSWIGQSLFGHIDLPISQLLPPAIEQLDRGETLFDAMPEFIPYFEKMAGAPSIRVGVEAIEQGLSNVDLWGFFQFHTRFLQPHQAFFRSLFQPIPELREALEVGLTQLRSRGKTIIGVHIRRGDFVHLPMAGFTLLVPLEWWCEWLDRMWERFDQPVLFLCSDDLDRVLPAFAKFKPVTCNELSIEVTQLQSIHAEFYVDFFILSQCDVVGISNSVFSFAACLLNERGQQFFRPCWDFSIKFVQFDPWESLPLLYIGDGQPKILKRVDEVAAVTLATQGKLELLRCLCVQVPFSILKQWLVRLYLSYQGAGWRGVFRLLNNY